MVRFIQRIRNDQNSLIKKICDNYTKNHVAGKTVTTTKDQFGDSPVMDDDDCACFLVEAIAKKSQNIKWSTTVDGKSVSHKKIRRVSLDQFYALVTGQEDAFYKMCMVLPKVIEKVVNEGGEDVKVPHDSVMSELRRIAKEMNTDDENLAMALAVYLLGFSTYNGFSKVAGNVVDDVDENALKRIYEYAKRIVNIR